VQQQQPASPSPPPREFSEGSPAQQQGPAAVPRVRMQARSRMNEQANRQESPPPTQQQHQEIPQRQQQAQPLAGPSPEDMAKMVHSMQSMMGPWLKDQIQDSVAHAVRRAAPKPQSSPREPLSYRSSDERPLTIDDISECVEESVRAALAASAFSAKRQAAAMAAMVASMRAGGGAAEEEAPQTLSLADVFDRHLNDPAKGALRLEEQHLSIPVKDRFDMSPGRSIGSPSPKRKGHVQINMAAASSEDVKGIALKSPAKHDEGDLPNLFKRKSGRKLTGGEMSVWTGTATSVGARTIEESTKKAFVINFRRLIKFKEKMDIIHEVIKATTIALLTLLAVRDEKHLLYDLSVLILGLTLYSVHEMSHDAMDTTDFSQMVGLLGNDGEDLLRESPFPGGVDNPNRCLQAMSFSSRGQRTLVSALCVTFFVVLASSAWTVVAMTWSVGDAYDWHTPLGVPELPSPDELEHFVTLLLVGTVMILCHLVFEWFYWREFAYYMPLKDGQPWDVALNGTPPGRLNWLFGLPCMWFSTPTAYDDLRIWVTLAGMDVIGLSKDLDANRPLTVVRRVFAEELAFYAIEDAVCAARVRKCLLSSKLFDKRNKIFMKRPYLGEINAQGRPGVQLSGLSKETSPNGIEGFYQADIRKGEMPSDLGVELVFFDSRSGEFHVPKMPENDKEGAMILRHEKSRSFLHELLSN